MARATRSSMAKAQEASSPVTTPPSGKPSRKKRTSPTIKEEAPSPAKTTSKKRTRASQASVNEDPDDFPHGLDAPVEDDMDVEPPKKRGRRPVKPDPVADAIKKEAPAGRSRRSIKPEPEAEPELKKPASGKRLRSVKPDPGDAQHEIKKEIDQDMDVDQVKPTPKKSKKDTYGLTPGQTPYPNYPHPTSDECREVVRILEKEHGKVNVPTAVPPPSLDVAGCGEVPSVLDALVRTRLSANTTNKNSSTAFQGLVKRFGVLEEGIGKGSVDWDAVRRAPQREVFLAIERGGLADRKSKDIQAILQIAYDEGQARKAALESPSDDPEGAQHEQESEKKEEVEKASKNVLSMDHLHLLSTDEAINRMLALPGIGPKTASCVALFCMRRPSFAVDTHVFRLCQYLGWVPKSTTKGQPKVDRNTTFSHCDVRIPDEYKYKLHYLLIKHGKVCPRCRAITGQGSAGWEAGCPIEHLVKRHGSKKGGTSTVDRKKAKDAAAAEDAESDDEES